MVVADQRRTSEAAADRRAATKVGPDAVARGLLVSYAVGVLEEDWSDTVREALEHPDVDPVASFASDVRDSLGSITTRDIVERSLDDISPSHPALIERLRAVDGLEQDFALADQPALGTLLDDPRRTTRRLLDALRGPVAEREILRLNEPRVTPGLVGWVLTGIVFAGIFLVRGAGLGADAPLIGGIIAALWVLFPFIYVALQQEVRIGGGFVRARSWWWRWLDRGGSQRHWRRVRWSGELRLTAGFEGFMTLTDGTDRLRWWGGIWSKRDLATLQQTLLDGGATVDVTSSRAAIKDPERHAVVWYVGDQFLVPHVKES